MSRNSQHHLRSERRLKGFTQADIAVLLGVPWKTRVARYERDTIPPTTFALAYETIYGKPVAELLAVHRKRIEGEVRERARQLLSVAAVANTPRRVLRQKSLERIAA